MSSSSFFLSYFLLFICSTFHFFYPVYPHMPALGEFTIGKAISSPHLCFFMQSSQNNSFLSQMHCEQMSDAVLPQPHLNSGRLFLEIRFIFFFTLPNLDETTFSLRYVGVPKSYSCEKTMPLL